MTSEWNVAVFLWRISLALAVETSERDNQFGARLARSDDLVEKPSRGRDVRICEFFAKFRYLCGSHARRVVGFLDFVLVQDVDRALRAHHGELGRGPGVIEIGANVLARHDAVR